MSVSRVREGQGGRESSRGGEGAKEVGGVSVQFTNTTVNSEAGQDTERVGGGVRKRLPVQECH